MAKSDTYWSNRSNKRMETYHKDSNRVILKISKAYDDAIKEINRDIERMLGNFMKGNNITKSEAKKLLNQKVKNDVLENYKKILPTIEDEELKQKIIGHIESQAYGARITRLEALKESIYLNIATVADVELRESEMLYTRTINKAYYLNCYDIQKGIGIGFNIAAMSKEVIEEILKTNWSGKHYSERVWNNSQIMTKKLEQVLLKGVMTGKSYRKLAIELEEMSEDGIFAAERLIRTEMTYVSNQAELESYLECGINKYIFVATLDLRTSKQCQKMDRKIISIQEAKAGENLPPLHPFCRSTTRAYLGEDTLKNSKRRARNPETGKTYLVPTDMNYKEWYEKYVVDKYGESRAESFEKIKKNKKSDLAQFKQLQHDLGKHNLPKFIEEFQELKYNNPNEWELFKDYSKSRNTNKISAFSSFQDYIQYHYKINEEIIGLVTYDGLEIKQQSKHFIERVFGTTHDGPENDFKVRKIRNGVEIEDVKEALLSPLEVRDEPHKDSRKYIGESATVTLNPRSGNLIQCNPTNSQLLRRLKND